MNKDIIETREPLLEVSKFKQMNMAQYEAIPVVKDSECPNCKRSSVDGPYYGAHKGDFYWREYAKPVGWCETSSGFMTVFECPLCFTKFRCHINTTGRYDKQKFYEDFALIHHLYYNR